MIKGIGIKLKGKFIKKGTLTEYYPTEEELEELKKGKLAVIGATTQTFNSKDGSLIKEHEYNIVNMDEVEKVDIFYDIEDDYMMDQTLYLKNGKTLWGMSRDHEEVAKWEKNGIEIKKGYGW